MYDVKRVYGEKEVATGGSPLYEVQPYTAA